MSLRRFNLTLAIDANEDCFWYSCHMTLRVCVVGFGKMGLVHSGVVNALDGSERVAVCESDSLLRRIGARLFKGVHLG